MNVNYELYKIFFVVASCDTITEASKKLYISQPAITKSIKKLEGQLHTTLFIRSTKGIKLSSEGKIFYNQIKPAIEQLLAAENNLSLIDKKITIGIDDIFIQHHLTNTIKRFIKLNKKEKIYIKESKTKTLINEIISGNISIGVLTSELNQIQNNKINAYKLLDLNLCLVGNYLIKNEIKTNNIKRLQIISIDSNFINNQNKIIVDNYSQIKELVNQNVGLGIIPKEFIKQELIDKKMFIIGNNISNLGLYVITNPSTTNNSIIKLKNLIIEDINEKTNQTT